jgi:hypothetical protein
MAGKSKAKAAPVEQEEDNSPMSTEIVTVAQPTALEAFGDPKKLEKMKADIGRALAEVVPVNLDMAKPADRKTLKSIAAKIPKLKTKMDAWGSESVEDLRAQITSVDAARKDLREFLDEKRTEIRKPLTEWEEAEEARKTAINDELERIRGLGRIAFGATSADIQVKLDELPKFDAKFFGDIADEAEIVINGAYDALTTAKTIALNNEADAKKRAEEQAELDALRRSNAEATRVSTCRNIIARIKALGGGIDIIAPTDATFTTKELIRTLNGIRITPDFLEFFDEASDAKDAAMDLLNQRVAAEAAERAKIEADAAAEETRKAELEEANRKVEEANNRAAELQRQADEKAAADIKAAEAQAAEAEAVQRHQEEQRTGAVMREATADERRDRSMAETAEDIIAAIAGKNRNEAPLAIVAGVISGKIRHLRFEA